jgi:hypothetical protein
MSVYRAWTQFLPTEQNEQVVIFFWVSPGDEMTVIVDATGGFTANFHLTNYSTNQSVVVPTSIGSSFGYQQAEWIMERPTIDNNVLPDLTGYVAARMDLALAFTELGQVVSYGGIDLFTGGQYPSSRSSQITMTNSNGNILSEVVPLDEFSMLFQWRGFG